VTVEGRTLTEVKLTVKNQAQPFLKVTLPAGATIVSADVAGEKVKPVQGPDGNRVPLLRTGFRPNGPYEVSFVFMHSGTPFTKKGGSELSLPSMDIPISLLEWEFFLPEQYKVKDFGGDAIAAYLLPTSIVENGDIATATNTYSYERLKGNEGLDKLALFSPGAIGGSLPAGQLGGVITDQNGAVVPGAQVKVILDNGGTMTTQSDSLGQWRVSGLPSGRIKVEAYAQNFKTTVASLGYNANKPSNYNMRLNVGSASTTVEVTADTPMIETSQAQITNTFNGTKLSSFAGVPERGGRKDRDAKKQEAREQNTASDNVLNLQKRVAGVLPVRVDVPRAGTSYRFARALVLDEETKVTFSYKTK
jgi:hypothetical protein